MLLPGGLLGIRLLIKPACSDALPPHGGSLSLLDEPDPPGFILPAKLQRQSFMIMIMIISGVITCFHSAFQRDLTDRVSRIDHLIQNNDVKLAKFAGENFN